MSFQKNVSRLHGTLHAAGFETLHELYPLGQVAERRNVIDCILIARRGDYEVIYAEVQSNQQGIGADLARSHLTPCLVITRMGDTHMFTAMDHDASKPVHSRAPGGKRGRLEALIKEIGRPSGPWKDQWEAGRLACSLIGTMNAL